MKSLVLLWSELARDLARACHTSTERDIRTVTSRVEHEGASFLTITLPAFGKAIDLAFQEGQLMTTSFSTQGSGLPHFLSGFLRQVFNTSGAIKSQEEVSVDAVEALRELCYVFQKVELPCSSERKNLAISSFVDADVETGHWDDSDHSDILSDLERVSSVLFRDVFSTLDRILYDGDITPRHGPGSTADRIFGNQKYDLTYWPGRLERSFPYREYGIPSPRYDMFCRTGRVRQPEMEQELPARVILVPKTLKTPRVISAEPTAMQWIQQGISSVLVTLLESDKTVKSLIGFTDQEPNRRLAREGSLTGSLATLDLKEASDRVSLGQVTRIFRRFPWILEGASACRSNLAKLPNGDVITIKKFAPMGSALCFPIEAVAFLAAIFVGIERDLVSRGSRHQLNRNDVKSYVGKVRVYGDDIIVPVDHVESIKEVFTQLGWIINSSKSFFKGDFRESCGGDYYKGEDVTPVKLSHMLPTSIRQVSEIEALVSFRNRLYMRGYWGTCVYLDQRIRKLIPFPLVSLDSPIIGRLSVLPHDERANVVLLGDRWDPFLHHYTRKGLMVKNRIPRSEVSGIGALLKCLTLPEMAMDKEHLVRAGRPVDRRAILRRGRPF